MFGINRRNLLAATAAATLASSFAVPLLAQDKPSFEFLYSPYADYAPFFVAEELSYFDEFGLEVTLSPKGGTAETIQVLASGNVLSGAAPGGAGLFNSIHGGATVTIVATLAKMPDTVPSPSPFMVSEEAWQAGIREIKDLKGKRVGIPGPGGFG